MSRRSGERLPQFFPLLKGTLDSPAWRALSHGARSLYVSLKRRQPKGRNKVWLSYNDAIHELACSRRKVKEWFCELEHYGFIVLEQLGSLGIQGKGKSPIWRLTELGVTSRCAAQGVLEPPTRDFLSWDGTKFDAKKFRNPVPTSEPSQFLRRKQSRFPRRKQANGKAVPAEET
jgi:hypothetical protein